MKDNIDCFRNIAVADLYVSVSDAGSSAGLIAAIVIIIILVISVCALISLLILKHKGEYDNEEKICNVKITP